MIRLTLALTVLIIGAMLFLGTESERQSDAVIGVTELSTPEESPIEPVAEVARQEVLDLTGVQPTAGSLEPIVTNASDNAALPIVVPSDLKILVVTGSRVNLREGPSTSRDIVGQLQLGEKAELLAEVADGWMQIRHIGSGRVGYMLGQFLTADNPE